MSWSNESRTVSGQVYPGEPTTTQEAYELLIEGAYELLIGDGYSLGIQSAVTEAEGEAGVTFTNESRVIDGQVYPSASTGAYELTIEGSYELLIGNGYSLSIQSGADSEPAVTWANESK